MNLLGQQEENDFANKPVDRGRTVSVVSFMTLIVAFCGYLREAILAAHFGLSASMDGYFAGMLIPNVLYLVLIAGTLSPVFIPIFLKAWQEDKLQASEVFSVVTTFMLLVFGILTTIGVLTARWWIRWLFAGFDPATLQLAIRVTYIVFPAVILLALAGICTALLNSLNQFAIAAFSPAVSSMVIIAATLLASGPNAIYIICIATAVGFFLQFALLLPATLASGIRYRFVLRLKDPVIRKVLKLGIPLFVYLGIGNASSLIERNLASQIATGAVSAIAYAVRLFAVPANLLAAPLAVVTYTHFARHAATASHDELRADLRRVLRIVVFIFLPISLWVVLHSLPITRVIYEHGHFKLQNSVATSGVLMMYSIGLLPNAMGIIMLRCFYALQDTITPMIAETVSLIFYLGFAKILSSHFGLPGLAATRGLAFFLVAGIFLSVLGKRKMFKVDLSISKLMLQTAIASCMAVGCAWFVFWRLLSGHFDLAGTLVRGLLLGLSFLISTGLFSALAHLFRIPEAQIVRRLALNVLPGVNRHKKKILTAAESIDPS